MLASCKKNKDITLKFGVYYNKEFFENYFMPSVNEVSDDQKGFAFVYPNYSTKTYYASLNLGYRRYGKNNLFRIGLSPGLIKQEFIPGGYISYGVTF